eukprot:TRINITY_DN11517_c0_g1_i1.p1 TRINITY_DN11517_c0_g1~~TRINITY_DN11517_c0_g1_i1.p1  ORF type:complete len:527 (+),score=274.84 TRINITY_DN11517_c0_g1_i1:74-1582(+)
MARNARQVAAELQVHLDEVAGPMTRSRVSASKITKRSVKALTTRKPQDANIQAVEPVGSKRARAAALPPAQDENAGKGKRQKLASDDWETQFQAASLQNARLKRVIEQILKKPTTEAKIRKITTVLITEGCMAPDQTELVHRLFAPEQKAPVEAPVPAPLPAPVEIVAVPAPSGPVGSSPVSLSWQKQQVDMAKNRLAEAERTSDELEALVMQLQTHQIELEQQIEQAQATISQNRASLLLKDELLAQKDQMIAELRSSSTSSQDHTKQQLEAERQISEKQKARLQNLTAKYTAAQREVAELTAQINEARNANTELSILYEAAKETARQMEADTRKQEILTRLQQEKNLEQQRDVQSSSQHVAHLQSQIQQMDERLRLAESAKAKLQSQIEKKAERCRLLKLSHELIIQQLGVQRSKYAESLEDVNQKLNAEIASHETDNIKWRDLMNQTVKQLQLQQHELQQSMEAKITKFREQKAELDNQRALNQRLQARLNDFMPQSPP